MIKKSMLQTVFIVSIFVCATVSAALAQTTAFNYQGRLSDAGNPPTATYQMEFKLFGSAGGADQIGETLSNPSVSVAAGNFTVQLDFGATAFDGTDRFLEIAVKRNANDEFTVLAPRQKINSAPYAVKSKAADEANNAAQLGGVAADEYVTTSSAEGSFIKNATTPQTGANFNIAGNGIIGGKFGVGMDPGGFKFSVNGPAGIRPRGTDESLIGFLNNVTGNIPTVSLSTSDGSQAEVRLQGGALKLVTGFGFGTPNDGITIARFGNVGVGTTTPQAKFHASGGSSWFQGDSTPLPAAAGKGIVVGFAGEQGYIQAFDYGAFAAKNLLLNNSGGNVGIGTAAPTAKLHVAGTARANVLEITGGSDLAEKFEFSETVKPGMVVAIDAQNAGKLTLARGAYNRQVAGIISGANNLAAGMLLPDLKETINAMPVALSGRVWVYADADKNPIVPGDLLTTSDTPGHAMKVTKHKKAQGAIIGKAMTELKSGSGLVLVLVTLQ